jgi:hypothetical protein
MANQNQGGHQGGSSGRGANQDGQSGDHRMTGATISMRAMIARERL